MSFRLTRAQAITDGILTSDVLETPPSAYDAGTTYDAGDQVSVFSGASNTVATMYESLVGSNLGNTPASSADEWEPIGTAYLAYNAGTDYALGAVVTDTTNHLLYESLAGSNQGEDLTDTEWWLELGPSNKWAMFDNQIDTQTVKPEVIEVEIALTGRMDTLGLLNVDAGMVNITLMNGETEIYNQDFTMVNYAGIANYWDHFFEPVTRKRTLYVQDLPIITGLTLIVTITNSGGNAAVGHMVFGRGRDLGNTQYGATLGYLDFSNIELDSDFGTRAVVLRGFKKQGDFDVWIQEAYVDQVYDIVTSYQGVPTLITATDQYSAAIYFGLITSAKINIAYKLYSVMRISVEDF